MRRRQIPPACVSHTYRNARALKLPLKEGDYTGFADDDMIPPWAKRTVESIRELGIVNGRGDNRFVPNDTATRAEATVMLLRMLEAATQLNR
ncbi:S-layer homology domain-containing protein [Paenibacillus sp. J5C2022]|uniref:S-layer homology domain-containing protein n=1 Tax=Paenibacillus sp. J5C2022 TaxID=2977129 RepID=UPI00397D72F9